MIGAFLLAAVVNVSSANPRYSAPLSLIFHSRTAHSGSFGVA